MNRKIYFVYVSFMGKLHPQKWYHSLVNNNTGRQYPEGMLIQPQLLTDQERNMTLAELSEKYPYVKPKEEIANV